MIFLMVELYTSFINSLPRFPATFDVIIVRIEGADEDLSPKTNCAYDATYTLFYEQTLNLNKKLYIHNQLNMTH